MLMFVVLRCNHPSHLCSTLWCWLIEDYSVPCVASSILHPCLIWMDYIFLKKSPSCLFANSASKLLQKVPAAAAIATHILRVAFHTLHSSIHILTESKFCCEKESLLSLLPRSCCAELVGSDGVKVEMLNINSELYSHNKSPPMQVG